MVEEAVEEDRVVGSIGRSCLDPQLDDAAEHVAEFMNVFMQSHDVNVIARVRGDPDELALVIARDPAVLQSLIGLRQMASCLDAGFSSLDEPPLRQPQQIAGRDLQGPGQGIQRLHGGQRLIRLDGLDRGIRQPGAAGQRLQRQTQPPAQNANNPKIVVAVHGYCI
jgi:hypothetical protein